MPLDFSALDTWILAGQSNMQGIGLLDGALPPDDRVWAFTMRGQWEVATEPLHPLWSSYLPVHADLMWGSLSPEEREAAETAARSTPPVCGAGLGLSFGREMADALGKPIGLLPCAHGGTSLAQWDPGLKDQGGHSLYGAMLQRVRDAGAPLRGLLWYQGESDAFGDQAGSYAERMAAWIAAVRADLGQPDLPVIMVQIGGLAQHSWGAESA